MTILLNNDLFFNAFNLSAIGMAIVSLDGTFLKVNSSYSKIIEYPTSELEQIKFQDITHPDDLKMNLNNLNRMFNEESPYCEMEKRYIKKNGSPVWVLLNVSLVKDETNKPLYYISQIQDISEQKALKEELKKSEDRYKSLIKYNPDAVLGLDLEGHFTVVNESCTKITDYSTEELLGMSFHSLLAEDNLEKALCSFQNALNGSKETVDLNIVKKNGNRTTVNVIAVPIVIDGTIKGIYAIAKDVTEQKRTEKELLKSEERYRALVESSPNAIVVHQEGKIVYINPRFMSLLKASNPDCLLGQHIIHFVHPEYHEVVKERINTLEKNISVGALEEKYVCFDGSIVDVEVIATPIEYLGKPAFQVIIHDISQRKEMESELNKSQDELKASEERFRLLAEYSSDMITMQNIKGTYLYASPACKEILQYDEDELLGQDAYRFVHPDDIEIVRMGQQSALNSGYSVFSYRIRRKDGEYVWLESAVKFMNEILSGKQKLIVVSRNISERILVEQKLQEANELLQHLSTIDGLTGISNRRTFDDRLEMEWNRGLRNSAPLSLLMLDIDYFKAYNDTYGHQGGDGCLKQIASVIQETLGRSTDLLCRYGGEEFCVILPETDDAGADIVGEKIRMAIEALKIPHSGSKINRWVTISVGAATMVPSVYTSYMNLVSNADKAVYKAKFDGRNCVRSYE
jgi:diguanylate cyclase (GGDEF)-like protein/PAS domain S-box-containing protein